MDPETFPIIGAGRIPCNWKPWARTTGSGAEAEAAVGCKCPGWAQAG